MIIQDATGPTTDQGATTVDADRGSRSSVADVLEPTFEALLDGRPPVRFEFWDGSAIGSDDGPGVLRVKSPRCASAGRVGAG